MHHNICKVIFHIAFLLLHFNVLSVPSVLNQIMNIDFNFNNFTKQFAHILVLHGLSEASVQKSQMPPYPFLLKVHVKIQKLRQLNVPPTICSISGLVSPRLHYNFHR